MSGRFCSQCGRRLRSVGSCPGCGRLPELEVDVEPAAASEAGGVTRVTTGGGRRRLVVLGLAGLALIAGLVLLADDEEAEDADDLDDQAADEPVARFEPVEGFEEAVLLQLRESDGAVTQFPLDGSGGPVVLVDGGSGLSGSALPQALLGEMLVGRFGGVSLVDGSEWRASLGPPHDGLPGPFEAWFTGSETVVMRSGRSFVELTATGEQIETWASPFDEAGGTTVGVAGRQLVHESRHGLHRFDLDTGELGGLGPGRVLAIGSSLVAVESCDATFTCDVRVVRVEDGAEVAALAVDVEADAERGSRRVEPTFSLDETRLLLAVGRDVVVVDTSPGGGGVIGQVAALPLEDGAVSGSVSVLWASDSSEGLLIVHGRRGAAEDVGVAEVTSFDRDLETITSRDDLRAALDAAAQSGAGVSHILSDRRFEPPAP